MDERAIWLEKRLRTLRDRIEHELGRVQRENCLALYMINEAVAAIESDTAAEISLEMNLPPMLPSRDWCRDCGGCPR